MATERQSPGDDPLSSESDRQLADVGGSLKRPREMQWIVLAIAVVLPSLVTWIYFGWLHGSSPRWQQVAYALGKSIQFLLPVAATLWVWRARWEPLRIRGRGMGFGFLFGGCVAGLIFAAYRGLVDGSELADRLEEAARLKLLGMGITAVWQFAAMGLFYSLLHALLEEYYWRWFVFDRAVPLFGFWRANLFSSLGFMAHHILLLGYFLGFNEWRTYLFAGAIALGGMVWAFLYDRTRNLAACWLSHALVDAAIFWLGYQIVY